MSDNKLMKATLFRSHFEAVECISDRDTRLDFLEALFKYQFYGEITEDLPEMAKALMTGFLPIIDKELEGKQGGRQQKDLPPKEEIEAMRSELGSMDAVADVLGVDKATIYRHISKEKQGKECRKTVAKCNVASVAVSQKQNVERENVECEKEEREKSEQEEKQEERGIAAQLPARGERSSPVEQQAAPALSGSISLSQNSVLFPQGAVANSSQSQKSQETVCKHKAPAFTPPSVEEVAAFCKERGNNVDAEAFVAFYASKGWMVGKNKMKDWRQSVITWEKRAREDAGAGLNRARASPAPVAVQREQSGWHSARTVLTPVGAEEEKHEKDQFV